MAGDEAEAHAFTLWLDGYWAAEGPPTLAEYPRMVGILGETGVSIRWYARGATIVGSGGSQLWKVLPSARQFLSAAQPFSGQSLKARGSLRSLGDPGMSMLKSNSSRLAPCRTRDSRWSSQRFP
jgi:hypothetical protein